MSGHSHWANIKGKKEANDAARGKEFSKISREIILAIQMGGGDTDPNANLRLRMAIDKAREVNMPKENVNRLIDRIKERTESMTEVVYEAVGPAGVYVVIKTVTDNPNRTHGELSQIMNRNGGKLVEKGAVLYMFDLLGTMKLEGKTEEEALQIAETIGGLDIEKHDGVYYVVLAYELLSEALQKAQSAGISKAPELIYKPKSTVEIDAGAREKVITLLEKLEEQDDVQELFTNVEFSREEHNA
ncbi:MAG: YebC/PmpR family DNA-binding transcriptional regulator [Patescibacteria group bacterium]|jgi:YebC/PmpR family DNA-binding regulatory protein